MNDMHIGIISPSNKEVIMLFEEADLLYSRLYPDESNHPVFSDDFDPNKSIFIAVKNNNNVIACGGIIKKSPNWAEIKRMYVKNSFRRRNIGKLMLEYLLEWALNEDVLYLKLETGIYQPEAISLYEKYNFYRIPPYEGYTQDPNSIFFELKL